MDANLTNNYTAPANMKRTPIAEDSNKFKKSTSALGKSSIIYRAN